jgi:hypothetical protein
MLSTIPGGAGRPRLAEWLIEGRSVGDAWSVTFVTGLTIGYGDIVPRQPLARALAIGIGVSGLFLTVSSRRLRSTLCAKRKPLDRS